MELRPCNVDDGPAIGALLATCFWPDPMYRMKFGDHTLEHIAKQHGARTAKSLLADPARRRHQKAVDPATGKMVGYARWTLTDKPEAENWWPAARLPRVSEERAAQASAEFDAAHWPHNDKLDPDPDPIDEAIEKMGYDNQWALDMVVVDPAAQRRGIGKQLLESGMHEAAALGQDVYIMAKGPSLDFYPRFGFSLIKEVKRDDTSYGPGNYGAWFMIKRNLGSH